MIIKKVEPGCVQTMKIIKLKLLAIISSKSARRFEAEYAYYGRLHSNVYAWKLISWPVITYADNTS